LALGNERVTGFCQTPQLPQNQRVKVGDTIKGIVLNVNRHQSIVDLSLRQSLVSSIAKADAKSKTSRVGTFHSATVELIHANYLVLSVSLSKDSRVLAIAPSTHFNDAVFTRPFQLYSLLSEVQIEICPPIEGLESTYLACRVIRVQSLVTTAHKFHSHFQPSHKSREKPVQKSLVDGTQLNSTDEVVPGMVIDCEVRDIFKSHMNVSMGLHVKGRIHITEVSDDIPKTEEARQQKPFDGYGLISQL